MPETYNPTIVRELVNTLEITGGILVFCPDGIEVNDTSTTYTTGAAQVPEAPAEPTLEPTWPWVSIGGISDLTYPNDSSVQTNDVRAMTPNGYFNQIRNTRTNLRPTFVCPFLSPELLQLCFGAAERLIDGSDVDAKIGVGGDNCIAGTMFFWLRSDTGVDYLSYQCHGWLRRNGDINLGGGQTPNASWMFEHDLLHGVTNMTIANVQKEQGES